LNKSEKPEIKNDFPDVQKEQEKLIEETKEIKSETEKKETRGRKKKENIESETRAKEFSQSTSQLGSVVTSILIERTFPEKPLNEFEKKLLDENFEKVLFKYAHYLDKWTEEVSLIAVLSFVFIPRFLDKKKEEKSKELVTSEEKK
jgi:hypothetical protein